MQILIELYDDEQILNLISWYQLKPDKVVFLYTGKQEHLIRNAVIERMIAARKEYVLYDVERLPEILEAYKDDEVYIDVNGGSSLAVAVTSRIAYENNIPLCYPDADAGKFYTLKNRKIEEEELRIPKLSIREIVELYGGNVRDLPESYFDDHGRKAVGECLAARRRSPNKWNSFCKAMAALGANSKDSSVWKAGDKFIKDYGAVLKTLSHVFDKVVEEDGKHLLYFHDRAYQILVTDTGVPFEYETYYQVKDSGMFDDVDLRVNIDWNGGTFVSGDPNSELDVVALKDGRLISISCKAGKYDQQAIYEVKANADKIGGVRSVPVLCVDIDMERPEYVEKARELNVLLIEHRDMRDKKAAQLILKWMETH